jgi:hypothetical protein
MRLVGKQVLLIIASEKNKTVQVYDLENEITSYHAVIPDVLAESVSGNTMYILAKGPMSKMTQTLREKTNIDKLESFLRKKHYEVAYKFAKNENFSQEVIADISRYYGDSLHSKVVAKFN